MRAKSSKQRCPALCILWLELLCSCRVGDWSGHLTASGSRYDFPGVDHEGRQTCRFICRQIPNLWSLHLVVNIVKAMFKSTFLSLIFTPWCKYTYSKNNVKFLKSTSSEISLKAKFAFWLKLILFVLQNWLLLLLLEQDRLAQILFRDTARWRM